MSEYTAEQQATIDAVKAQIREDIQERGIPFMERLHREHGPQDKQGMAWWEFVDTREGVLNINNPCNCIVGQYTVNVVPSWYLGREAPFYEGTLKGGLRDWVDYEVHGLAARHFQRGWLDRNIETLYNDAWREAINELRRTAASTTLDLDK